MFASHSGQDRAQRTHVSVEVRGYVGEDIGLALEVSRPFGSVGVIRHDQELYTFRLDRAALLGRLRGQLPAGGVDVAAPRQPHRRREPGAIEHALELGDRRT